MRQPALQCGKRVGFATSENFDVPVRKINGIAAQAERQSFASSAVAKEDSLNATFYREAARVRHSLLLVRASGLFT